MGGKQFVVKLNLNLWKKLPKSSEVEVAQKSKKKLCLDFDESEDDDEEEEDGLSSLVKINEDEISQPCGAC